MRTLFRYIIIGVIMLCCLTSCKDRPAHPSFVRYSHALAHADSLVSHGIADSAHAARLLSDLHREYVQLCDSTEGAQVRVATRKGSDYLMTILYVCLLATVISLIGQYVEHLLLNRRRRRNTVEQSRLQQRIDTNSRLIEDTKFLLGILTPEDPTYQEALDMLARLEARQQQLTGQSEELQKSLPQNSKRPEPDELTLIREQTNRLRQQEEQLRTLTANLLNNDELLSQLRDKPRYLEEVDWDYLRTLANRVYDGFTLRLDKRFPHLSDADRQLCLLMRLRFSNNQIAELIAVSPTTVSQQKYRLKTRMLKSDENLFQNGETVELIIWEI